MKACSERPEIFAHAHDRCIEDNGQISAAAHVLNISQPAASRMIAEIEGILEVPALRAAARAAIELTPYGAALARRARAVLLELREVDREISDLKTGRGGAVFLGAVTAPAIELAVPAIRKVRSDFPRIEISIQIETSSVLARELLASRHDFIIARIPDDLNPRLFEARVIGIEKACLIVRRGHPLVERSPCRDRPAARLRLGVSAGRIIVAAHDRADFMSQHVALPDRVLNTTSLLLTLVMVAQSDAIAPIALDVAKFINAQDGLAGAIEILPISFDIDVQPYSLIMARNRALSPAAKVLYDHILQEIR